MEGEDPDLPPSSTGSSPRWPEDDGNDHFGMSGANFPQSLGAAAAAAAAAKKEKGRVRFNSAATPSRPPQQANAGLLEEKDSQSLPLAKPRPSVLRGNSSSSISTLDGADDDDLDMEAQRAQARARERARQIAEKVNRDEQKSKEGQRAESRPSLESVADTVTSHRDESIPEQPSDIPMQDLRKTEAQHETPQELYWKEKANHLVRAHTQRFENSSNKSGAYHNEKSDDSRTTFLYDEINEDDYDDVNEMVPQAQYRGSVLSQLLKLYKPEDVLQRHHRRRRSSTSSLPGTSGGSGSGATTPRRKWYNNNKSQDTLANLIGASARLANPNTDKEVVEREGRFGKMRPGHKRNRSSSKFSITPKQKEEEVTITVHIAETLSRQQYIIKMCRALMMFGAPTHRLEEYLQMTARVLEIDGQFLYLPGCMIISFDDRSTHTTEVKMVRSTQGIDLGKLKDVHHIYKDVMHDVIGVEEGMGRLDALIRSPEKFSKWFRVFIFGITSLTAAPFSFKARLIDLPIVFVFGCLVGWLQLFVAPMSQLYSNVFEVSATVVISFLARAIGSINDGKIFCFGALAQGGIVMLLPGYLVLCSSLELQSRAIVPGSIRTVYAVIYSLLLGYGITIGASIYGAIDKHATSSTSCTNPLSPYIGFIFVPFFILCICIIYHAKWRQMPTMVGIAFTGYIVNYWTSTKFSAAPQIANTFGALTVGILANLYSRLRHGVAAAILIPAIFVQVPGGLASSGGLLSGVSTANLLNQNNDNAPSSPDMTTNTTSATYSTNPLVFNVAASMIQIAIGLAVGLFLSALVIYPKGKRRSGLFSF